MRWLAGRLYGQQLVAHRELVVGSKPDAESTLLAAVYVVALRSYGFGAQAETADDPMTKLDSGAFTVVPAFTGQTLQTLQPGASVLSDEQVYQAMIAALPEGIAAGDYATAAEDKPALLVTQSTANAWGGSDLQRDCPATATGWPSGSSPARTRRRRWAPAGCPLRVNSRIDTTMFAAVRAGQLTAGWTTTAAPDTPADLVVLADGKPALIQAENVVPLYRRNALTDRQVLAINEIAGVLDTAALADMRRQVAGGADPQAVAGAWLGEHPLGR